MEPSGMLDHAGDPHRAAEEAFREAGVTMLNVTPVGPEPARLIETVRNWL